MEEKEVQGAPVHKRRVRYSGTHPKRFEEKYKEQNPEKYADTVEKVIKKGSTPAGMHISICVNEILDLLDIRPGMAHTIAVRDQREHFKVVFRIPDDRDFIETDAGQRGDLGDAGSFVRPVFQDDD